MAATHLITCQDAEGLHDLFCGVSVSGLTCHEVQEGIKSDVAQTVRVHNSHNSLEVGLTLCGVQQRGRLLHDVATGFCLH